MRRPVIALLASTALVCAVSACGGEATIPEGRLSGLVLRDRDLPPAFSPFSVGPQSSVDATSPLREDPTRFGRKGGWIARYRRSGSVSTRGALVVVSRADLFGDSGGAQKDLQEYSTELANEPGATPHALKLPRLGDQAYGETFFQPGAHPVRYVVIAWRYRNVTASVEAEGFHLRTADVVALAQRQQRHIAGA
jgi:hypothetical protein